LFAKGSGAPWAEISWRINIHVQGIIQRLKHAYDFLLGAASGYLNELSFQIIEMNRLALGSSYSGYNKRDGFDCH
jgi:hypothetical protein